MEEDVWKQLPRLFGAGAHLLDCFDTWKAWAFQVDQNKKGVFFMSRTEQIRKLVVMALLAAISIVLVYAIHLPLIPAVPFLEYDPADIPILIAALAYGPLSGILLTVAVSVLQGVTVRDVYKRQALHSSPPRMYVRKPRRILSCRSFCFVD